MTEGTDTLLGVENLIDGGGNAIVIPPIPPVILTGTSGPDSLFGQGGDDIISGAGDDDFILGNQGDDTLNGGPGDDFIEGGPGIDTAVFADLAADISIVNDGFQITVTTLTEGTDTLNSVENLIDGGGNTIPIPDAPLFLFGTDGDDMLVGGTNNDDLTGFSGNDTLIGGAGDDFINGGSGTDTAVFADLAADISVINDGFELIVTTLTEGTDILFDIENLVDGAGNTIPIPAQVFPVFLDGTSGDDMLVGDALDDQLFGNDGDDTIIGAAGNDGLFGESGDDTLNGGPDDDFINGGPGTDTAVFADLAADISVTNDGFALFVTTLTEGIDLLIDVENIIDGAGTSIPIPPIPSMVINGTPGPDNLFGALGDDTINGAADNDSLFGDFGDDTLNGGSGDDGLFGDSGDDTLNGGPGDDFIDGGPGIDTAVFADLAADISIVNDGFQIRVTTLTEGTDTLLNVENLVDGEGNMIAVEVPPPAPNPVPPSASSASTSAPVFESAEDEYPIFADMQDSVMMEDIFTAPDDMFEDPAFVADSAFDIA